MKPQGLAAQFAEQQFGGATRLVENPVIATVGVSVVEILRNNPDRVSFMVMNRSANDLALGFTQSVTFATGLLVTNSGGFFGMNVKDDGEAVTQAVYAIANGAGSTIYVLEVRRP